MPELIRRSTCWIRKESKNTPPVPLWLELWSMNKVFVAVAVNVKFVVCHIRLLQLFGGLAVMV